MSPIRLQEQMPDFLDAPPVFAPRIEVLEVPFEIPTMGGASFTVGAVNVRGSDALDQEELMLALQPYLGRELQQAELGAILDTISRLAHDSGLVFATSRIPDQRMQAGMLTVEFDPGTIDRVETFGADSEAARAILAPLVGRPARQDELERRLLLVEDLPGLAVGAISSERIDGATVLRVELKDAGSSGRIAIDNRGIDAVGPVRATLSYDLRGLADADRLALGVQLVTTPLDPQELAAGLVRLSYVLDNHGTEVSFVGAASRTAPGGRLDVYEIEGEGARLEVGLRRALLRARETSLWLSGSLAYSATDQTVLGELVRRDRIYTATASLGGYRPLFGGRLNSGFALAHTLAIGNATRAGDPLSSRPDADTGATILSGWLGWRGGLSGPLSLSAQAYGQVGSDPLLALAQAAIGGPVYGRAYDFAERVGDSGAMGSIELRYALVGTDIGVIDWAQIYGFADGGVVGGGNASGRAQELYSAGFGGRVGLIERLVLEVEAAFPLNEDRSATKDQSPRISAGVNVRI